MKVRDAFAYSGIVLLLGLLGLILADAWFVDQRTFLCIFMVLLIAGFGSWGIAHLLSK